MIDFKQDIDIRNSNYKYNKKDDSLGTGYLYKEK